MRERSAPRRARRGGWPARLTGQLRLDPRAAADHLFGGDVAATIDHRRAAGVHRVARLAGRRRTKGRAHDRCDRLARRRRSGRSAVLRRIRLPPTSSPSRAPRCTSSRRSRSCGRSCCSVRSIRNGVGSDRRLSVRRHVLRLRVPDDGLVRRSVLRKVPTTVPRVLFFSFTTLTTTGTGTSCPPAGSDSRPRSARCSWVGSSS